MKSVLILLTTILVEITQQSFTEKRKVENDSTMNDFQKDRKESTIRGIPWRSPIRVLTSPDRV